MIHFNPFRPIRPIVTHAAEITTAAFEKPEQADYPRIAPTPEFSFLYVLNPELFENHELSIKERNQKSLENLHRFLDTGYLQKESTPSLYVYQQSTGSEIFTGIIGTVGVNDYLENRVRKHELIHQNKVNNIVDFLQNVGVSTSPVLLTYPDNDELDSYFGEIKGSPELYNFTSKDGVHHAIWKLSKPEVLAFIKQKFEAIPNLYIADGHHRCAASADFARKESLNPENTFFMGYCLPASQLSIYAFHRLLRHLNGFSVEGFLEKAREFFDIYSLDNGRFPGRMGEIIFWAGEHWAALYPKKEILNTTSYKGQLDVYLLEQYLLSNLLEIDPQNVKDEVLFVEGTLTLERLKHKKKEECIAAAFLLAPISVDFLMKLSDNGETLPPKSTWIEPKLRSGLLIQQVK